MKPIKFLCTKCGDCCKTDGIVNLKRNELHSISNYLNEPLKKVKEKYNIKDISNEDFVLVVTGRKGCPFLKNNLCSLQEVKPEQCKKYPFWPGQNFEKESEFCEGINHPDGEYFTVEELRAKCWS